MNGTYQKTKTYSHTTELFGQFSVAVEQSFKESVTLPIASKR